MTTRALLTNLHSFHIISLKFCSLENNFLEIKFLSEFFNKFCVFFQLEKILKVLKDFLNILQFIFIYSFNIHTKESKKYLSLDFLLILSIKFSRYKKRFWNYFFFI
jgi:DNA integrity scanning protein DisA with diadenylate cyclase activity